MPRLHELVLELTGSCPQRCQHCSSGSHPGSKTHLPLDVTLRLIDEAAGLGARKVSFGGGEPTASPILLLALRRVAERGMAAEVFTCGTMLRAGRLGPFGSRLVCQLREIERLKVVFSFHGPEPGVHDPITDTPGAYDVLTRSLDACLAAGITCEINFVPLRPNACTFGEVACLAENRGIARISILRFVPQGRGALNRRALGLSRSEEERFLVSLLTLRQHTTVEIRTGSPFNGLIVGNAVPCQAGSGKLVVQASGNVIPCEVFKDRRRNAWGLCAHGLSLTEILESPRLAQLRELVKGAGCMACPVHTAPWSEQGGGEGNGVSRHSVYA